jgi:transposase InsO family protein
MCLLLGVTKQAYYKHGNRLLANLANESFAVQFIKEVRCKDPGIGGSKLWRMYNHLFRDNYSIGYNHFYDIIDRYNLKVRKRKSRVRTTDSKHGLPLYCNLIKNIIPDRPTQVWVSDITYIPIVSDPCKDDYEFCFLSIITDYYTKEIVGYSIGESLETRHTMYALEMALANYPPSAINGLIHHSDRGVQYASYIYTDKLKKYGIRISMTESGDPKDNAVAERVNNTIKNELFMNKTFFSIEDVRKSTRIAVNFYNNERPHMSLDGMTPKEAAQYQGHINKKWISYRENELKKIAV